MLKKTIKYTDFNGNENEETFYFNLNKAELSKMELGKKGGMSNYIKEAVECEDGAKMVALFDELILGSYGVKSEDGKRFIKSPQIREEFEQSPAYSEIFMEITNSAEAAEAFVKAVTNR